MNPHYPLVAQRAAHHCEYCRAPEAVFNFAFEVEHNLLRWVNLVQISHVRRFLIYGGFAPTAPWRLEPVLCMWKHLVWRLRR